MKVDFTGRHIEVTEPLRKFATDRLEKLRAVADDIIEVHFILVVERHQQHKAEVNIRARDGLHHGEEVSADMYTSIAAVLDKIEKQLMRSKDKKISRKRRAKGVRADVFEETSVVVAETAMGESLPRVIESHSFSSKPLSLDEAIDEIRESKRQFLAFRNADTQRVNVIYKRTDGNIGWIDTGP